MKEYRADTVKLAALRLLHVNFRETYIIPEAGDNFIRINMWRAFKWLVLIQCYITRTTGEPSTVENGHYADTL